MGITPGTVSWFGGGCGLYVDGRLFDLRGNVVWTPDAAAEVGGAQDTQPSPDRARPAHVVASGAPRGRRPGVRRVGGGRLRPPLARRVPAWQAAPHDPRERHGC